MTRRSPYLLSVLNIGASVLTSHLSRILSRILSRCHAPVTPSGGHSQVGEMERSGIAAVSVYTHSGPGERKERVGIKSYAMM